jgi:hypothetical protein
MTKAERDARPARSKYWLSLRCSGCSKQCQYRTFRPLSGDLTLGKKREHRPRSSKARPFREARRGLFSLSRDPQDWRQRRRASVLGLMHGEKLKLWEQLTAACPEREGTREATREATREGILEDGYQDADQASGSCPRAVAAGG